MLRYSHTIAPGAFDRQLNHSQKKVIIMRALDQFLPGTKDYTLGNAVHLADVTSAWLDRQPANHTGTLHWDEISVELEKKHNLKLTPVACCQLWKFLAYGRWMDQDVLAGTPDVKTDEVGSSSGTIEGEEGEAMEEGGEGESVAIAPGSIGRGYESDEEEFFTRPFEAIYYHHVHSSRKKQAIAGNNSSSAVVTVEQKSGKPVCVWSPFLL